MDIRREMLRPLGVFRRQRADDSDIGRSPHEHGTWMPAFQLSIFILVVVLAAVPWRSHLSAMINCLTG